MVLEIIICTGPFYGARTIVHPDNCTPDICTPWPPREDNCTPGQLYTRTFVHPCDFYTCFYNMGMIFGNIGHGIFLGILGCFSCVLERGIYVSYVIILTKILTKLFKKIFLTLF